MFGYSLMPLWVIYIFNYIKYLYLYKNIYISPKAFLINCQLWKNVMICGGNRLENCNIGDYTYISWSEAWWIFGRYKNVTIWKFCSIAHGVEFINNSHYADRISVYPFFSLPSLPFYKKNDTSDIYEMNYVVGNDVWIWTWAKFIGNLKIWDGVIIGAGALVTKDVPSYSVVVGNPAKIIKVRDVVKYHKWWDLGLDQILKIHKF